MTMMDLVLASVPDNAAGYCIVVDEVALELTFDPADMTYGLAYAWAPDDYADGVPIEKIHDAIREWVEMVPADHPKPWANCYGCNGTGTLQWASMRAGVACSCVSTLDPDSNE